MSLNLSKDLDSIAPLGRILQYGSCLGDAKLREWCRAFTTRVLQPARSDFEILCHTGNTTAWAKVVGMLCERGDHILIEEYTYPSSQAFWIPHGMLAAPVAMDDQGVRDDRLAELLEGWDVATKGRRPHVLYLVSVGSNPSGVTMGEERRRRIYDVCVKYGQFSPSVESP
jgi:aromatic amino acid aminotransferase I